MIDLERISKEHEELFPRASLESQLIKLEEELKEFDDADDYEHKIKEAADVEIVCAGLYRWFPLAAWWFVDGFESTEGINWELVKKEVDRKWNINQLREWVWDGRTYRHKGKDGNE